MHINIDLTTYMFLKYLFIAQVRRTHPLFTSFGCKLVIWRHRLVKHGIVKKGLG